MTQLALYEMPKKECRRVAISVPIPKWLPPSLALWLRQRMAERPEGKLTVATRFSKGERAAMKRRRPVPISAWAEKHRVLEMSAIRGRWRNVFTPYLTGISAEPWHFRYVGAPHAQLMEIQFGAFFFSR